MALSTGEAKIDLLPGKMRLAGSLLFGTVLPVYQAGIAYLDKYTQPALEIDLSHVEKSDSSGLALLLGWMKLAKHKKIKIRFIEVPQYLHNLAKVCGMGDMLVAA